MNFWVTVKKKLMKEVKKKLNAKFECHMVGPHALSHEVFTFIYIYIYIWIGFIIIAYGVYINISINCVLKFNEGLISSGFL